MSTSYDSKPWYIQKNKQKVDVISTDTQKKAFFEKTWIVAGKFKTIIRQFAYSLYALICVFFAGICFVKMTLPTTQGVNFVVFLLCFLFLLFFSLYLLIVQIGNVCHFFMEKKHDIKSFLMGTLYLRSKIEKIPPKKGGVVPELILRQFLQQVRIYASEKNYNHQKRIEPSNTIARDNILNRRWNDVQDTLDEFDIYLANNPKDVISKLITNIPCQQRDVSSVFQEVAETAESTWRPKGVNIEHAIVVPLKSNIDDKLLRRLLAGPWRACAYLCIRGRGVVFSAKRESNKISVRWECEGSAFPDNFFKAIKNQSLSVNERIEEGMELISNNPKNSNTLLGLISLIIWHDLAYATKIDFDIKQGGEGMIIKVILPS